MFTFFVGVLVGWYFLPQPTGGTEILDKIKEFLNSNTSNK